ncbi:MAG: hypothetical protein Q8R74_07845 [Methylophilus sp.]|nr:hypothetical protein [Methylophilus sp.]
MQLSETQHSSHHSAPHSALFDPDLPTASSVMASLNCVAVQYVMHPSLALAELAARLAYTLTAPEYAESTLVEEVAKNLVQQWDAVVHEYHMENNVSGALPAWLQ